MSVKVLRPPPELAGYVGDGDFEAVGRAFRDQLVRLGGLRPTDRVLDMGSGCGRMAVPLTELLDPAGGGYEGVEIVPAAVAWCRDHITPAFPHFRFTHADVFNAHYNPTGRLRSLEYRFPFPAASFDFAFLTSVFTHMLPRDVEGYVRELSRVLRPGGQCLATFYLLDPVSLDALSAAPRRLGFRHRYSGGCRLENPASPEAAVAYERGWMERVFAGYGFAAPPAVTPGRWSGRADGDDYQDIVVATKVATPSFARRVRSAVRLAPWREWAWHVRRRFA